MLKNKEERKQMAMTAINTLKNGIENESISLIINAFEFTNDSTFSWLDLDDLFIEWNALCEDANDILNKIYEY